MQSSFYYLKGFLWAFLEMIVYIFFIVIISGLLAFLSMKVSGVDYYSEKDLFDRPLLMVITEYGPLLIGSLISLYITHTVIFKRSFSLTGFVNTNLLKDIGIGSLLAFSMLSIGFLILYGTGLMEIEKIEFNPTLFFGFLLFFAIQSSFEEVVSRAFMIPSIANRLNVPIALLISSSIFALLHLSNPNISWISLSNIFLAGALMGLLFLKTKRIWAPIALHALWNFLQGSFFGFEVSGYDFYSFIDSKEIGNDLLTGGEFGFEGSIISLIMLLGACSFILWSSPEIVSNNHRYKTMQQVDSVT